MMAPGRGDPAPSKARQWCPNCAAQLVHVSVRDPAQSGLSVCLMYAECSECSWSERPDLTAIYDGCWDECTDLSAPAAWVQKINTTERNEK